MTLNQFTLFAAVAKHLNVRKASEELRVSQPSVSQQLKQLEDRYGLKLYRRLSKGIEITEQGQAFLRNITPILEQVAKSGKRRRICEWPRPHGRRCARAELSPPALFCCRCC